jgi:hypothetical protein
METELLKLLLPSELLDFVLRFLAAAKQNLFCFARPA